jgi:hypothetical protein
MKIQANRYGISERVKELVANLEELEYCKHNDIPVIELSNAKFITPLSILPLAVYADYNDIDILCSEEDNDVCRYLETIGFPNGLTKMPKTIKGYLPMTRLPPVEDNKLLGLYEDNILSQAQASAEIRGLKNGLKYLTSELVNNVNEHAKAKEY